MISILNRRLLLAALGSVVLAACSTTNPATLTGQYQAKANWTSSFLSQVIGGQDMPDGINNWECRSAENQNPVVLIHGTFSSSMYSFGALGPALANQNLCVYSIDYGAAEPGDWFKGVGPVDESAQRIAEFVKLVKTRTGRDKATLVGHSQGGLIGFYYLKMLQGAEHVDRFVALAPSVNGTAIAKTPNRDLVEYCLACADQHPRSALLQELKTGPITMPGVQYSILVTKNDKVVVPVENQFVKEPGVQNIYIQDLLPGKRVSHSGMLYDTDTLALIVKLVQGQPVQTASN
ncbi:MAG: alpha/beta fold hydrolase [Burkholderiales bacterium]|jgi:pimeloyl-ACP methyl ester carboxylesterase|uniref:esterase/lipase family protein n=1 Tax=Limnobacter sp. TaxID=2003368 RepID=UPI00393D76FB|nr:alpha/beta fold hydrolase [Burkholderiales bacterium]